MPSFRLRPTEPKPTATAVPRQPMMGPTAYRKAGDEKDVSRVDMYDERKRPDMETPMPPKMTGRPSGAPQSPAFTEEVPWPPVDPQRRPFKMKDQ